MICDDNYKYAYEYNNDIYKYNYVFSELYAA